jgi:hypothetical protein
VVYPGSGTLDGVAGDHIKLTPPLILTDAQVEELAWRSPAPSTPPPHASARSRPRRIGQSLL